jgi:hypothetical protein
LFSLPWTVQYKGHSFTTYYTGITQLLKNMLPKGFNYYEKLFAGELIYRLIEQRIINEMTWVVFCRKHKPALFNFYIFRFLLLGYYDL